MANAIRGMPTGIHTVDLAHSSLVIHRVRMPFGIPRRPAPTTGVVRISTKTLHTLYLGVCKVFGMKLK